MSGKLIFITGASGFIGSNTAIEALKNGYRLRVCLRKSCERLKNLLSAYDEHVEYVIIPNLLDESAFKGQLKGVDYVLHIASPVPHPRTEKESCFASAVNMTTAILREANRSPSVKKVVITSSTAALVPLASVPTGGIIKENNDWDFDVNESADFNVPNDPSATAMHIYHASKLLANKATWNFWRNVKPHYSLAVLYPGYTYGYNPMQMTAEQIISTSNQFLWETIMDGMQIGSLNCVHVKDVAEAHVKALNPKIADGSSYALAPCKATWKEVADIVHRDYPNSGANITKEMEIGRVPFWQVDCSKAKVDLEMEWRSIEQMVHDVMDQQMPIFKFSKETYEVNVLSTPAIGV